MNIAEKKHFFNLFPWLVEPFKNLVSHQIPNSLIISGQKDIGKFQFGFELCKFLLCESSSSKPCESCEACNWVKNGNHPDLFLVVPQNLKHILPFEMDDQKSSEESDEKKQSKFIRIDQIRNIVSSNELGSYRGGKRVVLIYPAESMQTEAANCLLKTLEEPSINLYIILVTHHKEKLLPTIRSRCQIFNVPKPSLDVSVDWLCHQLNNKYPKENIEHRFALHSGAPLKVLSSIEENAVDQSKIIEELSKFQKINPNKIIDLLSDFSLSDILNCTLKWTTDINLQLFGQGAKFFPEYQSQISSHCKSLNKIDVQNFLSSLNKDLKLVNHPLFPKVQLEATLVRYKNLF
jgi:DNA polymerase-3 subunit delta'